MESIKASAQSLFQSSSPPQQHQAAVISEKGARFKVEQRPTPKPKEDEILVQVRSAALNPVDIAQRDFGFNTSQYPGVLGSDVGGVIAAVGSSVSHFMVGDRVTAFAPAFDNEGLADYGAFQEYVLCPASYSAKLPASMSFNEAAMFPMAVQTAMAGFYSIDILPGYKPAGEAVLVWGGSSSVGSTAVQIAKVMGFRVYATASPKHHDYVKSLGASRVFDYRASDVVGSIVGATKEDGVDLRIVYDAAGSLPQILDVLGQLKGGKVASAIPLKEDDPQKKGVEVKFVLAPTGAERTKWSTWVFNEWLEEKIGKEIVPSPKMEVVKGGLEALNSGLDRLKEGMSGTKLVVEL